MEWQALSEKGLKRSGQQRACVGPVWATLKPSLGTSLTSVIKVGGRAAICIFTVPVCTVCFPIGWLVHELHVPACPLSSLCRSPRKMYTLPWMKFNKRWRRLLFRLNTKSEWLGGFRGLLGVLSLRERLHIPSSAPLPSHTMQATLCSSAALSCAWQVCAALPPPQAQLTPVSDEGRQGTGHLLSRPPHHTDALPSPCLLS